MDVEAVLLGHDRAAQGRAARANRASPCAWRIRRCSRGSWTRLGRAGRPGRSSAGRRPNGQLTRICASATNASTSGSTRNRRRHWTPGGTCRGANGIARGRRDAGRKCPDCGGSRYASEADAIRRAIKAAKGKAAKMKVSDKRKAAKEKLSEATDQGGGNVSLSLPQLVG